MSSNRKYLFGTTVLAGLIAISAPAFAQDNTTQTQIAQDEEDLPQATQLEEIVVTGSRIQRTPANSRPR